MTAAAFEARSCPTWANEIKKTKFYTYTKPAAVINFLLCTFAASTVTKQHGCQSLGCVSDMRGFGIGAAIRSFALHYTNLSPK